MPGVPAAAPDVIELALAAQAAQHEQWLQRAPAARKRMMSPPPPPADACKHRIIAAATPAAVAALDVREASAGLADPPREAVPVRGTASLLADRTREPLILRGTAGMADPPRRVPLRGTANPLHACHDATNARLQPTWRPDTGLLDRMCEECTSNARLLRMPIVLPWGCNVCGRMMAENTDGIYCPECETKICQSCYLVSEVRRMHPY